MPPSRSGRQVTIAGFAPPRQRGLGIGRRHRVQAQLDQVGVSLGGDARLPDGVAVLPDDRDAELRHKQKKPP